MKKNTIIILTIIFIIITFLNGCKTDRVVLEVNGRELYESELKQLSLEYDISYDISLRDLEEELGNCEGREKKYVEFIIKRLKQQQAFKKEQPEQWAARIMFLISEGETLLESNEPRLSNEEILSNIDVLMESNDNAKEVVEEYANKLHVDKDEIKQKYLLPGYRKNELINLVQSDLLKDYSSDNLKRVKELDAKSELSDKEFEERQELYYIVLQEQTIEYDAKVDKLFQNAECKYY